ncbi:hypothetical protein ACKWTF_015191 [Chironomus riparius]
MKLYLIFLLRLSLISFLLSAAEAQTARCDYSYQYHWTTGHKSTNASYYTCSLDTSQVNFDEELTNIDGQHETGHDDADVKWITRNKDQKLKTFSSIFCRKFPNIEVVTMNDMNMESIDEDALLNCPNLDHLFLDGNRLREVPENFLTGNSKLTLLWMFNNHLTTLPEDLFLNQLELDYLSLDDNQINFLPSGIFRSLAKLTVLNLYDNNFRSINPKWFVNLQNLNKLALDLNQITELPSKCFSALKNLEKLWLFHNKIQTLNSDSFNGLQNLKTLNLRNNEISDLPAGVFTQLINLQYLYLQSNKLTTIDSDSFGIHNQLTVVWLQDNLISSIDEKFIDNTAVSNLNMTNNICSQYASQSRPKVKNYFMNCFANYQPRSVHVPAACGQSVMPQGQIIGGATIKPNSYPWIAALLRSNGQFFCGGTLVSNRKVVTAAHCIQNKEDHQALLPRQVIVLLGFHDLSNSIEIGRSPYAVQSIQIHPDWNPYTSSYDADIAVLMLYRDVTFNEFIQPICMTSTGSRISAKTEGIVVGNGKGGEANEYENIPKILKMPIQTARHCTNRRSTFRDLLTGRTFCAGTGTGQGVCSGDSGSGFVVEIGSAFYLRGIVSASLAESILGCDVNSYSVFTDALKYVNWIDGLSTVPIVDDRIIYPS